MAMMYDSSSILYKQSMHTGVLLYSRDNFITLSLIGQDLVRETFYDIENLSIL